MNKNLSPAEYSKVKGGMKAMEQKKGISTMTDKEIKRLRQSLGTVLEIYGKGDPSIRTDGLRILNGWGRIVFIISNDGKRIGLELTERREREREAGEK
jgi:hypothetical protein